MEDTVRLFIVLIGFCFLDFHRVLKNPCCFGQHKRSRACLRRR
jgi:hypothetical protein